MRRSQRQIIRLLLGLANEGIKPTPLMHAARLKHSQMQRYLKRLIGMGLIEKEGPYHFTTENGRCWLEAYAALREIEEPRRT